MTLKYVAPTTISEAVQLLEEDNSQPLAGGTDLMVDRRSRNSSKILINIKQIPELCQISPGGSFQIEIGSCTTMKELKEHPWIRKRLNALFLAASTVGSVQIRSRATIGGNLANGSPCADTAPALLVLGASIVIVGSRGMRKIPLSDFFLGAKKTNLQQGEIVKSIKIELPCPVRSTFLKIKRVQGPDLALVNLAGAFYPEKGILKVAVGSAAPIPILLPDIKTTGSPTSLPNLKKKVSQLASQGTRPIDDVRSSAEYRRRMISLLSRRMVDNLFSDNRRGRS